MKEAITISDIEYAFKQFKKKAKKVNGNYYIYVTDKQLKNIGFSDEEIKEMHKKARRENEEIIMDCRRKSGRTKALKDKLKDKRYVEVRANEWIEMTPELKKQHKKVYKKERNFLDI